MTISMIVHLKRMPVLFSISWFLISETFPAESLFHKSSSL